MKQPILIVQGDLDPNVPPAEADRLAELARARKKAPPTEVVHVPDADHEAAPARKCADAIAEWIKKLG